MRIFFGCTPVHDYIWVVEFSPFRHLFQTGNDPLRIFAELNKQCELLSCQLQSANMPAIKLMDSEQCYLSWRLEFSASADKAIIEEAFEWVADEADITITKKHLPVNPAVSANINASDSENANVKQCLGNTLDNQNSQSAAVLAKQKVNLPIEHKKNIAPSATRSNKTITAESSSIRVDIDKVDSLINMVGELVITQSMLGQLGDDFDINHLPKLIEGLSQLEQNTRELQESVMRIRMLPISFAFSRFPRMIRDLGQELNKNIHLVLLGENTELDKTVMEKIGDPLMHLVRNSVDHGIEPSEERMAKGKPKEGTVTLNAYHQGGNVVIEIVDDGRGLDRGKIAQKGIERNLLTEAEALSQTDEQIFDLIFQPGFSTANTVSSVSGRGVGMDVVKRNIQALNGVVGVHSTAGNGTKMTISLPLTLAILDGQLVRSRSEIYIFPLASIVESMQYREELVNHIAGGCNVFKLRNEYIPIVDLSVVFGYEPVTDYSAALMVVVESDGCKVAMIVNELLAQQQVVIKSIEQNYQRVEGVSGATILGDGTVALIVDVAGVVRLSGADQFHQQHSLPISA